MATDESELLLTCIACEQRLQEPVQLVCLHHCCRRCLHLIAARPDRDGSAAWGLNCKACGKVTPARDLDSLAESSFIAARLLQLKLSTGPMRCQFLCSDDDFDDDVVEHWCNDCRKALCSKCLRQHGKLYVTGHSVVAAASVLQAATGPTGTPSLLLPLSTACGIHKKEFDFYCVECGDLKCGSCGRACLNAGHRMQDSVARAKQAADSVRAARSALVAATGLVKKRVALLDIAAEARKRDAERLKSNKRAALDAVNEAYERSELTLQLLYNKLDGDFAGLVEDARLVDRGLSHALAYSDALLGAGGNPACLLLQELRLLDCLRSLTVEACAMADDADAGAQVAIDAQTPDDFVDIVQRAIGLPRAAVQVQSASPLGNANTSQKPFDVRADECATHLPASNAAAASRSGIQVTPSVQPNAALKPTSGPGRAMFTGIGLTQSDCAQASSSASLYGATPNSCSDSVATAGSTVPLATAKPSRSFKVGAGCRDIAVTNDGRVLIADGCLKEYEASGRLVSEWMPPPVTSTESRAGDSCKQQDKVFAIGLSGNGSIVAGLFLSCRLLLLKRAATAVASGPAWQSEGRDLAVPARPVRLSACGDLCAVSCTDSASFNDASRCIYLVSLINSTTLLNLDPLYDISNLHLTSNMIVVSSKGKQSLGDGSTAWVVDAYQHAPPAERLWRNDVYGEASGICMSPRGDASVCIALRTRAGVIESIDARGGSQRPILKGKPELDKPWLVAASCNGGQQPLLAVVSGDSDHVVTVYQSIDFS